MLTQINGKWYKIGPHLVVGTNLVTRSGLHPIAIINSHLMFVLCCCSSFVRKLLNSTADCHLKFDRSYRKTEIFFTPDTGGTKDENTDRQENVDLLSF